ncbi:MAG: exodeoxyribonuclease VII small subunit [Candidatus Omnitrophica bacterium]|nr:exodeoxyribonuclease VII small subunit [Candidatus Omnitrophota bacterium]
MPKEELKYSKAIEELEKILNKIQNEEIDIDDLAREVKRAIELIKLCKEKIEKTELEVKEVIKSFEEEKN